MRENAACGCHCDSLCRHCLLASPTCAVLPSQSAWLPTLQVRAGIGEALDLVSKEAGGAGGQPDSAAVAQAVEAALYSLFGEAGTPTALLKAATFSAWPAR